MDADTPDRQSSPRRTALATRLFLSTAILVTLALGGAILVTSVRGKQIAESTVREDLERSASMQLAFEEGRLGQLRLIARMISGDPHFSEYIRLSIESGDALSILDQLDERRRDLDFDFAMVLDAEGLVVARTDAPQGGSEDLANDPLVRLALEEFEAAGVWQRGDSLYDVVAVPVASAGYLDGFLIVGYAIDDETAVQIRRVSATEVAFLTLGDGLPSAAASTLETRTTESLEQMIGRRQDLLDTSASEGGEVPTATLELGGEEWIAAIRMLEAVDGHAVGAVVALGNVEETFAPYRRIQTFLAGVGLCVLLLALGFSYAMPRRVLGPVRELAEAARSAAEGDYDQEIVAGSEDEVGQLADAFSSLLSDLREKRDMEKYINELARTLPDQESAETLTLVSPTVGAIAPDLEPPAKQELVLLGAEIRDRVHGQEPPLQTLERLSRDLTPLRVAILEAGGKVEKLLGHRLVASFEGPERGTRALSAAAAVSRAEEAEARTVLVLVAGAVTTGPLRIGRDPERVFAGPPVEQMENLLRVARAGSLLITQAVRSEVESRLKETGTSTREVRSSVSAEPLYTLASAELAALPGRAATSATLQLDATRVSPPSIPPTMPPPLATAGTTGGVGTATLSSVGPGSVLGQRFEILSVLGAGGMGVVYKARDRSLQELVALKMLRHDVWDDEDRLQKLKDELKLARKIAHPNVLRTYDFGELDGVTFITMEYVRGITLKKMLQESGRLPLSAGLRLARQLCQGLCAAHREKVLHRDIKPENLILEHTGNVKLMDFGIATPIQHRSHSDAAAAIVGTPFYLAPEQLEGREADVRSDLYASGVVLYEIFTGKLPYDFGKTLPDILAMKVREEPKRPSERWPGIPPRLEQIVLRCLARDPDARYSSTDALLRDLQTLRG